MSEVAVEHLISTSDSLLNTIRATEELPKSPSRNASLAHHRVALAQACERRLGLLARAGHLATAIRPLRLAEVLKIPITASKAGFTNVPLPQGALVWRKLGNLPRRYQNWDAAIPPSDRKHFQISDVYRSMTTRFFHTLSLR